MIIYDQVQTLMKICKTNEVTVVREYLQLYFLARLYDTNQSSDIFFKGGTAVHLVYKASRFSEDLDFTVELDKGKFLSFIERFFKQIESEQEITFKVRKTIIGMRYLMTTRVSYLSYPIYINLDFSFREKVFEKEKSILTSNYPVIFQSYVYHLSKNEIVAEKVSAILSRDKGRDIYDLWYLLTQGVEFKSHIILAKLAYYDIKGDWQQKLDSKIREFSKSSFVKDLRPFVPFNEREKLGNFYEYIQDYVSQNLKREKAIKEIILQN